MEPMPDLAHSNGSRSSNSSSDTERPSVMSVRPFDMQPCPADADADVQSPSGIESSPITSPPYWVQSHRRSVSNISIESIQAGAITLQDNEDGENYKSNEVCWARGVHINDHVVVNSSRTGIGAFVVWNIKVETMNGGSFRIRKRYSEFDDLRDRLLQTFPLSEAAMPSLPPKGLISKFRPKFLEQRRIGLSYFLNCILLNPEFSASPVLKEFLFE